jgi:hypothetical protein
VLKRRKGFVKLALRYGVDLVPTFSFGESFIYGQACTVGYEAGPLLRSGHLSLPSPLGSPSSMDRYISYDTGSPLCSGLCPYLLLWGVLHLWTGIQYRLLYRASAMEWTLSLPFSFGESFIYGQVYRLLYRASAMEWTLSLPFSFGESFIYGQVYRL